MFILLVENELAANDFYLPFFIAYGSEFSCIVYYKKYNIDTIYDEPELYKINEELKQKSNRINILKYL